MRDLFRGRNVIDDQIKQCAQVLARAVQLHIRPAGTARGIHGREIQLIIIGTEVGEQVKTFIQCAVRFRIRFVDLVQNHDRAQAQRQGFRRHELGLRHRAFGGVNQQDNAIDHAEDTLDLTTEIGVAGGVDDVDARVFPFDRSCLGQNGDATLALQIVAVHGAFRHGLVFPERAGLFEQLIHQGRLAVVHVSDDCDVAQVHERSAFEREVAARIARRDKIYQP